MEGNTLKARESIAIRLQELVQMLKKWQKMVIDYRLVQKTVGLSMKKICEEMVPKNFGIELKTRKRETFQQDCWKNLTIWKSSGKLWHMGQLVWPRNKNCTQTNIELQHDFLNNKLCYTNDILRSSNMSIWDPNISDFNLICFMLDSGCDTM